MKSLKSLTGLIIALACIVAAVGMGCKKDGGSSKLSILTSGSWTLKNWEEKNSSGAWVQETHDTMPNYVLTFNSDHTCTVAGNSNIGKWESNSDYTHITITGILAVGDYNVVTLTSSSLTLDDIVGSRWVYIK